MLALEQGSPGLVHGTDLPQDHSKKDTVREQQQIQLVGTSVLKKPLLNKIFSNYFLVKYLFNLKEKLWKIVIEGWEN